MKLIVLILFVVAAACFVAAAALGAVPTAARLNNSGLALLTFGFMAQVAPLP